MKPRRDLATLVARASISPTPKPARCSCSTSGQLDRCQRAARAHLRAGNKQQPCSSMTMARELLQPGALTWRKQTGLLASFLPPTRLLWILRAPTWAWRASAACEQRWALQLDAKAAKIWALLGALLRAGWRRQET